MTGTRTELVRDENGDAVCPDHGDTLTVSAQQGDELEWREHLECSKLDCGYEVWA